MGTNEETHHLRYGDTVLLTQKGAMLGSYYTNSAVSNLFMLPLNKHCIPPDLACAKICGCFKIMPCYEFESLEELKEIKSHKKLDWNKILELENSHKREEKENERRLNRFIGRVVRYDHAIQLLHIFSDKMLTASPNNTSLTEPRNFACYLDEDPGKRSRFKVLPAVDGYDPGDPVNHSDFINLFSDPDGFVGTSDSNLDPVSTLYPPLSEVYIGPRGGGFSIKLNKAVAIKAKSESNATETAIVQNGIFGGDLVQFYNKNLNLFLSADEDNNLILKKPNSADGKHINSVAESFWVIENVKAKYSSPVQISSGSSVLQDIYLTNFITGKKALFPSGADEASLKTLIKLKTPDVKSGDCIKFFSGKAWLSFGGVESDGYTRKLVCCDHRDHTDVFTIHKIDAPNRQRMFKLLGFKMLLAVVEEHCGTKELTVTHLRDVLSAIREIHGFVNGLKKKVELYENCYDLGITGHCFNICNHLIPRLQENEEFKKSVESMVGLIRDMMKYTGDVLDNKGLDLTENLLVDKSGVGLKAFLNIIRNNVNLVSMIPIDLVERLVQEYTNTSQSQTICLKVLRKLCKCKKQAVPSNQNIIIHSLLGSQLHNRFARVEKTEEGGISVLHEQTWVPFTDLSKEIYAQCFNRFLSQLDLIRNMLFGRNALGKSLIVVKYNMFSESECVEVITNEAIDLRIRSRYIKILVAAHIDHQIKHTAFEPRMLSYHIKRGIEIPSPEQDVFSVLDDWLIKYVENNTYVIIAKEEENTFKDSVIMLVEYMFRKEDLDISSNRLERYIKALIEWLDGKLDKYYDDNDATSMDVFRRIFRFRNLPDNKKCNQIKERVLETLHLSFWHCLTEFWEKSLFGFCNSLTGENTTNRLTKTSTLKSVGQGVLPATSIRDAIAEIIESEDEVLSDTSKELFFEFLEHLLSDIYLFAETSDIMTVVYDVLNYDSDWLTTSATELTVLLFSPIDMLLSILPKTRIMITEETYNTRRNITEKYFEIRKLATDPLSEELFIQVIESLTELRNHCLNEDYSVNKTMQKFVFDLGTVKELIRIVVANKVTISSTCLPTDTNDYMDGKLLSLKVESFRLLKVIISGFEQGQELVMAQFKALLAVKDEDGVDKEKKLEQVKAYALDEIFTDNTNLSLNVKEDEILAVFHEIIRSVTGKQADICLNAKYSYLYLSMIENMIDMEGSTDVLCKHQTYVLRLIREYWNELNGRVMEESTDTLVEMNLLSLGQSSEKKAGATEQCLSTKKEKLLSSQRSWQGLYFSHMVSLMACCVVGDAKSTETICKEQYPLDVIFPLLIAAKADISYFTCLSKFILNVYIKSSSVINRQQLLGTNLTWYISEGMKLVERVTKILSNCTTSQKLKYLVVLRDLCTQIKLLSSRDDVDDVFKDLVCYYDFIFFVLCPIVIKIFSSDQEMVLSTFNRKDRRNIITQFCTFAKFVSPFLHPVSWKPLFGAIEAVNALEPNDLSEYFFSDEQYKMHNFRKESTSLKVVDMPVAYNTENADVMDLVVKIPGYNHKESYTQIILNEIRETEINDGFQAIASVLVKITTMRREGTSVKMSEELKSLGLALFEDADSSNTSMDSIINFSPFFDDSDDDCDTHVPISQLAKIINKIDCDDCSKYVIIRLINVFASLAEDSDPTRISPASSLLTLGLTEALGSVMASCEDDSIQQAVTECLLSLLEIPSTKNRLHEYCTTTVQPLFEWCSENIKAAIEGNTQLCMMEASREKSGIKGSVEDVGIVSSTPMIRLSVQLIGAMCEGQYTVMQNYLRFQDNKIVSWNFLVLLIKLLHCAKSGEVLMDTIKSINSLISANDVAKETAIENDIVEVLNKIIAEKAPANDEDNAQEIKASSYSLLSTLVEQSNMLNEFYDKVQEELDVKTLQSEINSHMSLLGSENGDKAQIAAFKGYALLKKISALDKIDYVGKLDEEIAQKLKVASVEIQWKGHIEKVYYPIPRDGNVRNKVREEMKWGIDRKSKVDKQRDFLVWSQEIVEDVEHQRYYSSIPFLNWIMRKELWWDWLVFLIAAVLQLWLLLDWVDIHWAIENNENSFGNTVHQLRKCEAEKGVEYHGVCPSNGFYYTIVCLGMVHLVACLLLAASYFLANCHRISFKSNPNKRMLIRWSSFYHFYLLAILVCSGLGIWSDGILYCFHLFHIATLFDLLGRVIRGATKHADQLLVCAPFAVIIAYVYAILYFGFFRDMFDNNKMEYCNSLGECLVTVLKNSLRPSSGGHNYSWTNRRAFKDLWLRLIIDATFWILFTIIGLNVVTSLILDGFRQLKAERERALKDMTTLCTICGLSKDELVSNGISWTTHVDRDHNLWNYVTFFYYLKEHDGRFSAVENEVLRKFQKTDPSFLPSGRCISMDTRMD